MTSSGKELVPEGALQVAAGGEGAALFAQSGAGLSENDQGRRTTAKLRLFIFRDGHVISSQVVATRTSKAPSYSYVDAGTAAAGDLGHAGALVAWTASSVYSGVSVLPIGARGQRLGPVRSYGVPHYAFPSEPYDQAVPGNNQGATAPRLSYNQQLHRYLLVWNEGEGTAGRAVARVLDDQGLAVSPPERIPGLMYASLAPTPSGWLGVSGGISPAPELVALSASGGVVTRRRLHGTTQAILVSHGDSDLIAWSTAVANFHSPRFVWARRLTSRGEPQGRAILIAKITPTPNRPMTILPVQATATTAGYIVGWQYQSRNTFSYRRLNDRGIPSGRSGTDQLHDMAGSQRADLTAPALALTPARAGAWLWLLGQTSFSSARVVAIP